MSLPTSLQVMKEARIENEKYYSKRQQARKMFEPLKNKYKGYGLTDLPIDILTKEEKLLLYKCFRCFVNINDASLFVFGNIYSGNIIDGIFSAILMLIIIFFAVCIITVTSIIF